VLSLDWKRVARQQVQDSYFANVFVVGELLDVFLHFVEKNKVNVIVVVNNQVFARGHVVKMISRT
jgi:hypothetical protein